NGLPREAALLNRSSCLCRGRCAELIEYPRQLACYLLGRRLLNHVPLHEIHELAIAKDCDRWRGRLISIEIAADPLRRFSILTGKHGNAVVWLVGRAGERQSNAGAHLA